MRYYISIFISNPKHWAVAYVLAGACQCRCHYGKGVFVTWHYQSFFIRFARILIWIFYKTCAIAFKESKDFISSFCLLHASNKLITVVNSIYKSKLDTQIRTAKCFVCLKLVFFFRKKFIIQFVGIHICRWNEFNLYKLTWVINKAWSIFWTFVDI